MNEIVNRLLLARDKRMPKMNLRQPGYTYSVCDLFTRNKKRIHKKQDFHDIFIKTN